MTKSCAPGGAAALLLALALTSAALADSAPKTAGSDAITIRALAEVETHVMENGRQISRLLPADRVVPGDEVIYTLEIRNTGAVELPPPTVDYPVPEHTRFVADSASGPGADISFSIDGGLTYDRPENLEITDPKGSKHVAGPEKYTHIRWQLKNSLKSKAVAFARFRAVVK